MRLGGAGKSIITYQRAFLREQYWHASGGGWQNDTAHQHVDGL